MYVEGEYVCIGTARTMYLYTCTCDQLLGVRYNRTQNLSYCFNTKAGCCTQVYGEIGVGPKPKVSICSDIAA